MGKKNTTVATVLQSNRKIVGRSKINTCNTEIHDRSVSRLGTGTSIKSHCEKESLKIPKG
jgi:hypothetical protein